MLVRILDFVPFVIMHFILMLVTPKKKRKSIVDIYFYSVILGLIGARLFYVLFNLEVFSGKLLSIIYPSSFNLSLIGGIVVSLLLSLILGRKKGFDLGFIFRKYCFSFYSIFFMLGIVSYIKRVMYPLHIISGSVMNIILSLCLFAVGIASEYVIPKENKIVPSVLFLVILIITQIVL
jgi:phosphatidylglycerol:prolipoprotein diacylglycerol transferase